MGKARTSKKQRDFSIYDMPIVELKKGVKTRHHDPEASLRDADSVMRSLVICLYRGDFEAFKEILHGHLLAKNITHVAKKAKLSVRTIHNALSKDGNPTIETISKLIQASK